MDGENKKTGRLRVIGGVDPYETEKQEWKDNIDLWPSITHVNLGMYLLVTPSPYSGEDLLNYKSLDCYRNFLSGWVREVLVRAVIDGEGVEKRVVTAKVCAKLKEPSFLGGGKVPHGVGGGSILSEYNTLVYLPGHCLDGQR